MISRERLDRLLIVLPQLVQEAQPALRVSRVRVVGERQRVVAEVVRACAGAASRSARRRRPFASGIDIAGRGLGFQPDRSRQTRVQVHDGLQRLDYICDLPLRRRERFKRVVLPVLGVLQPAIEIGSDPSCVDLGPARPVPGVEVAAMVTERGRSVLARALIGHELSGDRHRCAWRRDDDSRLPGAWLLQDGAQARHRLSRRASSRWMKASSSSRFATHHRRATNMRRSSRSPFQSTTGTPGSVSRRSTTSSSVVTPPAPCRDARQPPSAPTASPLPLGNLHYFGYILGTLVNNSVKL